MKGRCCRSLPRCRDCPVLTAAIARRPADPGTSAALVATILAGPRPPLPSCVEDALTQLDEARAAARRPPPAQLSPR